MKKRSVNTGAAEAAAEAASQVPRLAVAKKEASTASTPS